YLGALDDAADLEAGLGEVTRSAVDRQSATRLRSSIWQKCWDESKGLIADSPAKTIFSQDAIALAVLYHVVPKSEAANVLEKAVPPGSDQAPVGLLPASYYFRYYVARAYLDAGVADRYIE